MRERPWTAFYGPGVRASIEAPATRDLPALVRSVAAAHGRAPAFTCCLPNGMNGTLSFAQVDAMSDAFAVHLREVAGLCPGDRVAVQMPNGLAYPVAAFGALKAGCNPLYTEGEMARLFEDAAPRALVVADMFAGKVPAATRRHPIPHVVVARVAEFLPALPRAIAGLVQRHWDRTVRPLGWPHVRLPGALASGARRQAEGRIEPARYAGGVEPDDVALLQYTGGTTGAAKGAMLTHRNLLINMEQTLELTTGLEKGREVALTALPLYHIFAFTVNLLGFWALGARNVLIPSPRPLSNLRRAFENYPITWMSGVNTLFNGLCNELWFTDSPPRRLRFSSAGGMALQGGVARRWEEVTGTPVLQGYGLTETSPVLTFNPLGKSREGSIGVPVPSTDILILDDEGRPLPPGEPGEIAARGPQVMKGYWRKPEETAKAMAGGAFRTGDVGVMDPDGYVRIVDRKKDMVIVSGFNVYPNEVEEALSAHPGIAEVAVIGVPDAAAGEAVKAFVVLRDPGLTPEAIRAFARGRLAAYKVPKAVEVRQELPRSNVGKILRKDLRAEAAARAGQGG